VGGAGGLLDSGHSHRHRDSAADVVCCEECAGEVDVCGVGDEGVQAFGCGTQLGHVGVERVQGFLGFELSGVERGPSGLYDVP
jgi:hypothetical protein